MCVCVCVRTRALKPCLKLSLTENNVYGTKSSGHTCIANQNLLSNSMQHCISVGRQTMSTRTHIHAHTLTHTHTHLLDEIIHTHPCLMGSYTHSHACLMRSYTHSHTPALCGHTHTYTHKHKHTYTNTHLLDEVIHPSPHACGLHL